LCAGSPSVQRTIRRVIKELEKAGDYEDDEDAV
jgi:hypothetical protein